MKKRDISGRKTRGKGKTRTRQNRAEPGKKAEATNVVPIAENDEQRRAREAEIFEARRRQQVTRAAWELDEVDGRILELKLRHPAMSQAEIGDMLGLNRNTVGERINAPKFKRAIAVANEGALTIYQDGQAEAARKLRTLIHDPDSRVAIRACIAHLWPMIHQDKGDANASDFTKFIAEAYELAEAQKAAATAPAPEASAPGVESPSDAEAGTIPAV